MGKTVKDRAHPSKIRLALRIEKECARRSIAVFLMYMFMSMIMLAFQAIKADGTNAVEVVLGVLCIAGGMFYNGHLCYHCGITHYDAYVTGCMHRKNEAYGITSGGDHRPEKEYRFWKGPLIGLNAGALVIILGLIAGAYGNNNEGGRYAIIGLSLFAGWAILPLTWIRDLRGMTFISFYWSILFVLIPVAVSTVFYILGAMTQKRKKAEQEERVKKVEEAGKRAREEVRVQTEEQRKKTLQSKKKK